MEHDFTFVQLRLLQQKRSETGGGGGGLVGHLVLDEPCKLLKYLDNNYSCLQYAGK